MKKQLRPHIPDASHREALLHRIERITELPLLVLAFAMIPLLIGPLLWTLSPAEESVFLALDTFIWAIFAVDLGIKVVVATHRKAYCGGTGLRPWWWSSPSSGLYASSASLYSPFPEYPDHRGRGM